jgi:hypothetical protein
VDERIRPDLGARSSRIPDRRTTGQDRIRCGAPLATPAPLDYERILTRPTFDAWISSAVSVTNIVRSRDGDGILLTHPYAWVRNNETETNEVGDRYWG